MNKDLFKRYLDNSCTSGEREQVLLWLQDPDKKEEVLTLMEMEWGDWTPSEEGVTAAAKEMDLPFSTLLRRTGVEGRESMLSRTGEDERESMGRVRWLSPVRKRVVRVIAGVAASLLFLVAGAWLGYHYKSSAGQPAKLPVFYATAQTLRGQRSKVLLSDGSEIYLNGESRLSFSNEANSRSVVYLEGEAFFKVPEKEKPLIVKTRDMVASAKGSQFNISAFPKDSVVTISVQHGQARISANNEQVFPLTALRIAGHDSATGVKHDSVADKPKPKTMPMMVVRPVVVNANESVTFDKTNKLTTRPNRLTEDELRSWKDGFIFFNHTDSAGLVDKLQRWFDVEVILDTDGTALRTLNCGFRNPTLTEVLNHISKELSLEYRIEGKKVFLHKIHS